jgi:hypothetical protein
VGQNQVAAITQRCYSIAEVSVSTDAGATGAYSQVGLGGIVGYNAVSDKQAEGTVQNCFALNPSLTAPSGFERVYRAIGDGGGTLSGNMAHAAMTINGQPSTNSDIGHNAKDGATCPSKPAQSVYENLGWDFNTVWEMGTNGYPRLQWQDD